jgi:hypothetical protein
MGKIVHFMYVPWTGLGLYGGFRGNRWLRNRIKVFKQFVVPSLLAQTSKNFVLWCSWRWEEKHNPQVIELEQYLKQLFPTVFTYQGVCFWDDKYSDEEARIRLLSSLHGSIGDLTDIIGEAPYVLMTIQPSDDCYDKHTVKAIQEMFDEVDVQAMGYTKGYMMNYLTGEVCEYNPDTIPPFFTIKFPRDVFIDPLKHTEYTGPYKSHEYIADKLKFGKIDERGFIVGCHGENISTVFNHPFRGKVMDREILKEFGLFDVPPIKIRLSVRKWLLRKLPHRAQRKLRYIFGEKLWQKWYEFIRN